MAARRKNTAPVERQRWEEPNVRAGQFYKLGREYLYVVRRKAHDFYEVRGAGSPTTAADLRAGRRPSRETSELRRRDFDTHGGWRRVATKAVPAAWRTFLVGARKTNPKRRVVRVRAEDHRDFSERMPVRKPRYAHQSGPQRYAKIRYDVTYETITPESAEYGDADERGYKHKGLTEDSVADMVRTLRYDGATEASSSHWHKGLWYTAYGEMNYRDGSTTNLSYHIRAPEAVQREIARAMGVRGA